MNTYTHGPFTWTKCPGRPGAEVWQNDVPADVGLTFFCLKNYGGTPGPGFAGWKLVSGGPFDTAGAYSSFKEAVDGVTPWLIKFYAAQAAELTAKAQYLSDVAQRYAAK